MDSTLTNGQYIDEGAPGEVYYHAFAQSSAFLNCLKPLLKALDWTGDERHLAEALPHFADSLDLTGFCKVMANIHYEYRTFKVKLQQLDRRLLPCLFVPRNAPAMIILDRNSAGITVFNGSHNATTTLTKTKLNGKAYLFQEREINDEPIRKRRWFVELLREFRGEFLQVLGVSFIVNLLALATPIFIMAIYNLVINAKSYSMLSNFGIGISIALLGILGLQLGRAKVFAYIGAKLDYIVGKAIFERLLYLSPSFTETATVGAQVARIKDFDSVREFFTGPFISLLFEVPFIFIFIIAIAILGGPLAYIPVGMIVLFTLTVVIIQPTVKRRIAETAKANAKRQEFLLEALNNMRALKYTAAESIWEERYKAMSAKASIANYKATVITSVTNTISDIFMILAGLAIVTTGAILVINEKMNLGGLIASMILVWRVLSPIKTIFSALSRFDQILSSIKQINNLMNIDPERDPSLLSTPMTIFTGKIRFNRVSMRYRMDADPAVIGVSFESKPGEVIAITGRNGSGKSTVLKLLLGMYQPQAGSIHIDNMDIRQLDPVELRHALAYVPQTSHLFYGTIEQNLRLAAPLASKEKILTAMKLADIYDDIMALPKGLQTQIRDQSKAVLPSSIQQRISLARAYLKESAILILDEPVNALDPEGDRVFLRTVEFYRQQKTILFVTHRPSHLKIADRILVMERGQLVLNGTPEQVLPKIPKDLL